MVYVGTVQQVWSLCVDDDQRHEVLAGQIESLIVSKAAIADGQFHSSRVELTWSGDRKPIVPEAISVGPIHRRMREVHPWISLREASKLAGSSEIGDKGRHQARTDRSAEGPSGIPVPRTRLGHRILARSQAQRLSDDPHAAPLVSGPGARCSHRPQEFHHRLRSYARPLAAGWAPLYRL